MVAAGKRSPSRRSGRECTEVEKGKGELRLRSSEALPDAEVCLIVDVLSFEKHRVP